MEPGRAGPGLSRYHFVSFWHELDHGELLAGLVRNHSVAGRLDHGRGGRASHRRSAGSLFGDLRKRSRRSRRESFDQTVHRIHFRDSFCCSRIFRDRRRWPGGAGVFADAVHEMGAILPNQRTPQCFYGGRITRADGGADDFHFGGRCIEKCSARI